MAADSHPKNRFEFSSKEFAESDFMLPIVEELYSKGSIDEKAKLRFILALQEAFANGLEHGNLELTSAWKEEFDESGIDKFSVMKRLRLSDPKYGERKLFIESSLHDDVLEILVKDQGRGFNAPTVVKVMDSGEIPQTHGRGIAIMLGIMDEVSYSENGRQLKMVKRLTRKN